MKNNEEITDSEENVKNNLRLENYKLLPQMRELNKILSLELTCTLKDLNLQLNLPERIEVVTRIKECDSAINSLRRRQVGSNGEVEGGSEGGFDTDKSYSLMSPRDFVGARVLYFPSKLQDRIITKIKDNNKFKDWTSDPVKDSKTVIAEKYFGKIKNFEIYCEYQVVSMLIGGFWDVEHSAYYKSGLKISNRNLALKDAYNKVMKSLREFEDTFEKENE